MKSVDLVGLHLDAGTGAPLVLLREHDAPYRVLPIQVGQPEAASVVLALAEEPPPRPVTHDLLAALVESLDAHVDRVEVTAVHDGAFIAELSMSGPTGERRLDSRPSDAIALAVRVDAPMYVSEDVLDEAGAILAEGPDDEEIDEEVARFRSFLETLDPTEFGDEGPGDEGPGDDAPGGEAAGQAPGLTRSPGDDAGDDEPGPEPDDPGPGPRPA